MKKIYMMTNNEIKDLLKNTDFFANECMIKNLLAITESELMSIISNEIKNIDKSQVNTFLKSFINLYKQEILKQDKTAYRNIIQEVEKENIGYIVKHLHPRGKFITELDDNISMYVSTISELTVEYYKSKNEMLADIILKQCFNVKYDTKQNKVMINAIIPSAEYIFSKDILLYIKNNLEQITTEILNQNTLLTSKNQENYDLFKEYLQNAVADIFSDRNKELPKNIKIGDKMQTKYCDMATVIDINTEDKTIKLDREIQNEITVFTDTINYQNEHIITNILSPEIEDSGMEVE